jgi:hypothetical protein
LPGKPPARETFPPYGRIRRGPGAKRTEEKNLYIEFVLSVLKGLY